MLKGMIIAENDAKTLEKLFSFEDKSFSNGRAGYEYLLTKKGLVFDVWAQDSVALRSVLNTITKIMTVHEKTKKVLK